MSVFGTQCWSTMTSHPLKCILLQTHYLCEFWDLNLRLIHLSEAFFFMKTYYPIMMTDECGL